MADEEQNPQTPLKSSARRRLAFDAPPTLSITPSLALLRDMYHDNVVGLLKGNAVTLADIDVTTRLLSLEVFEDLIALVEENPHRLWKSVFGAIWLLRQAKLSEGQSLRLAQALTEIVNLPDPIAILQKRERKWRVTRATISLFLVGIGTAYLCRFVLPPPFGNRLWYLLAILSFLSVPVQIDVRYTQERCRLAMLEEVGILTLAKLAVPESVPALAKRVLQNSHSGTVLALMKTLPNLTARHYGRLDPQTTEYLCKILDETKNSHPELTFLVLEALENVGDSRAIRPLQHLMTPQTYEGFPSPRRLKQAFARTFAAVQKRAEAEPPREEESEGENPPS